MKIWNNPELEELEIKLTANGETESDTESSATDVAVMCFGGGYWWNNGWGGCDDDKKPGWGNNPNKPNNPCDPTEPTDPSVDGES